MNSERSSRRASLDFAPTILLVGTPSLKTIRVVILITSKRLAISASSSTFNFAICICYSCSEANSSKIGAIILQGPHHSAQKSTSIGFSDDLTTSSKVAAVSGVVGSDMLSPVVVKEKF